MMDKYPVNEAVETIETTVGELVEIITDIALEAGRSEAESYALVAATIEHMTRNSTSEEQGSD